MAIWGNRATVRVEASRSSILVIGLPASGSGDTFLVSVRNPPDGSLVSQPLNPQGQYPAGRIARRVRQLHRGDDAGATVELIPAQASLVRNPQRQTVTRPKGRHFQKS